MPELSPALDIISNLRGSPPDLEMHVPEKRIFEQVGADAGLSTGCYCISIHPPGYQKVGPDGDSSVLPEFQWYYEGTLRIESEPGEEGEATPDLVASGDLYLMLEFRNGDLAILPDWWDGERPDGIPVYDHDMYAWYVAMIQLDDRWKSRGQVRLGFDLLRIQSDTLRGIPREAEGPFRVDLERRPDPVDSGHGSGPGLQGVVYDASDAEWGTFSMVHVGEEFRRCRLEVQRTPGLPEVDGARDVTGSVLSLKEIFRGVGWSAEVVEEEIEVSDPPGGTWDHAHLHRTMLGWRSANDLDRQWTYHLLVVPEIDGVPRGVMYDGGAIDSNEVPREGAAVEGSDFFDEDADLFRTASEADRRAAYFRTAVHELGHAMGLDHNTDSNGFMNTTDRILDGTSTSLGADAWSFHADDQWRLRHWPDPAVRPGGIPMSPLSDSSEISALASAPAGLELRVEPVVRSFPLGAPVRLELSLSNRGAAPVRVRMDGDVFFGRVMDLDARSRRFRPINRCREGRSIVEAGPASTVHGSVVLMRGSDGALFPEPGLYRVKVMAEIMRGHFRSLVAGYCEVEVSAAATASEDRLARTMLEEASLFPLGVGAGVLGPTGRAFLRRNPDSPLAGHFSGFEARRTGRRRDPDSGELPALPDGTVLTAAEKRRFERWRGRRRRR